MLGQYPAKQTTVQFSSITLYREIGLWVVAVKDVAANLPPIGARAATQELFEFHQKGLTDLATLLIDYTEQQRHPYYKIIHRSEGTLAAAKATIDRARRCARLFAGYYAKPKSYNQVDVTVEMRYLLAQLTNLWEWLNPKRT